MHPSSLKMGGDGLATVDLSVAKTLPTLPKDRACVAPEERSGQPGNARSSVFSIGAILYELLTGESVGPGMRRPSQLSTEVNDTVENILSKALVSDPAHRPDDINALAAALHSVRPSASIAPPSADVSHLDADGDFEVDVRLSMVPPAPPVPKAAIPRAAPLPDFSNMRVVQGPASRQAPSSDAVSQLGDLKNRLESDQRPRYVVIADGMDHGPFNGIELLQQIASNTFKEDDVLRDTFANESRAIKDWPEFAPFAEQARLNREVKAEKQAIERVIVEEKKSTTNKALLGGGAIAFLLVPATLWFIHSRTSKETKITTDDPNAISVDVDGGVSSGSIKGGKGRLLSAGGVPQIPAGLSCEAAQSRYIEEMKLDGKQPDLKAGDFGKVLNNGSYLSACGVPDSTKVNICAAIQFGRAVGVTVSLNPPNPGIAGCVAGKVRGMSFPSNPGLDVTHTTF